MCYKSVLSVFVRVGWPDDIAGDFNCRQKDTYHIIANIQQCIQVLLNNTTGPYYSNWLYDYIMHTQWVLYYINNVAIIITLYFRGVKLSGTAQWIVFVTLFSCVLFFIDRAVCMSSLKFAEQNFRGWSKYTKIKHWLYTVRYYKHDTGNFYFLFTYLHFSEHLKIMNATGKPGE